MKIIENKEPPAFKPVTIVLETQGEVDYIGNLVGCTNTSNADKTFKVDSFAMYNMLQPSVDKECSTENTIRFKECK